MSRDLRRIRRAALFVAAGLLPAVVLASKGYPIFAALTAVWVAAVVLLAVVTG